MMESTKQVPEQARKIVASVVTECQKTVVGKTEVIEDLLLALISGGHVLLEGVPGVAKTTIGKTFSSVLGLGFKRIQGSPDTLPADIVGTHIFDQKNLGFKMQKGPIFSNIVLIDEINRNTPKTNSAVLEAMQEKQVTIDGETVKLPYPFMVIATQSPIEFYGVFPIPEVLTDRFLLSLKVDYPSPGEEIELTDRMYSIEAGQVRRATTPEQISYLIEFARGIYIAPHVQSYMIDIVHRTRRTDVIALGASPRASLAFMKTARARALIKGRAYVSPDDVKYLAPRILRHRITLSSVGQTLSSEAVVDSILEEIPIPIRAL